MHNVIRNEDFLSLGHFDTLVLLISQKSMFRVVGVYVKPNEAFTIWRKRRSRLASNSQLSSFFSFQFIVVINVTLLLLIQYGKIFEYVWSIIRRSSIILLQWNNF